MRNSAILKDKLQILFARSGMTRAHFAELLGVTPGALSQYFSGRNNPGYDAIVNLLKHFPDINPYWLLGNSDKMENNTKVNVDDAAMRLPQDETSGKNRTADSTTSNSRANRNTNVPTASANMQSPDNAPRIENLEALAAMHPNTAIEKVVIFFADNTFEVFTPHKK